MRSAIATLLCGVTPVLAYGQAVEPVLPKNEAIIAIGWAGSEKKIHEFDRWHSSLFVGVTGGRYWTPHLKTEIEIGWQSPARGETYQDFQTPDGRIYTVWDYRTRERRVGAAQVYQFGRNAWVHPYLGVGADFVWTAIDVTRTAQTQFIYANGRATPVAIPAARERQTHSMVQPYLKTGVKMYLSDRAFVNTELKLGFSSDLEHTLWKLGLGFDF